MSYSSQVCSSVIASTEVLKLATRILDEASVPPSYTILAVISNVEDEVEEAALVEIAGQSSWLAFQAGDCAEIRNTDSDTSVSGKTGVTGICPIYQDFEIDIRQAEQKHNDPFAAAGEPRQMS